MTTTVRTSFRRAMRRATNARRQAVHFHVDADGRAFACHATPCDASVLTLREASLTETGARRRVR